VSLSIVASLLVDRFAEKGLLDGSALSSARNAPCCGAVTDIPFESSKLALSLSLSTLLLHSKEAFLMDAAGEKDIVYS
jgi:hypothetical protein